MNREWIALTGGNLTVAERTTLLTMVWEAQRQSALTNVNNASNAAVRNAAVASLSLTNALVSGMMATGGLHAPVTQAREFLFGDRDPNHPWDGMVPGFGNSFHRECVDPVWQTLLEHIRTHYHVIWGKIDRWSATLRAAKKACHPNAAAFTAAAAELVGWPKGMESLLVIEPRMTIWSRFYAVAVEGRALSK